MELAAVEVIVVFVALVAFPVRLPTKFCVVNVFVAGVYTNPLLA